VQLPSRRRGTPACPWLGLALLASAALVVSCGTEGDDSLGLALLGDRGERKAVRDASSTADTSTSFQRSEPSGDLATSTELLVSARPGYLSRSLLRFDLTDLQEAGVVVDSASVEFVSREGFGTSPFSLAVHRVTGAWAEAAIAPADFPAFDAAPSVRIDVPFAPGVPDTFPVPLTALAQAWAADSTANLGVALLPDAGEDAEIELYARESSTPPRLVVHWTASGADTSAALNPVADAFSLGTTGAFVPLPDQPRRFAVARGLAARALLRFDWPDPGPRATIHRAELTLHVDASLSSANSIPLAARRVLAEPWNGFDTSVDPVLEGITVVAAGADSVVLDVTAIVVDLIGEENHGFEIRATDEQPDTDYLRFHAHDTETAALAPTLRVWWTPGDVPGEAP
jgi:hypothetical protein